MENEIKKLLLDHEKYHSAFQIDNFIIGSQGNSWAQYKQCLREIDSRNENIKSMKDERELLILDIEKLKSRFRFLHLKKRLRFERTIKLRSAKRRLISLNESIYHSTRELIRFVNLAKKIKKESWGDKVITGDLRDALDCQMWMEKVKQMLAIDLMSFGAISKPTTEMIFNMPRKDRQELLESIKPENREKLIEWSMM